MPLSPLEMEHWNFLVIFLTFTVWFVSSLANENKKKKKYSAKNKIVSIKLTGKICNLRTLCKIYIFIYQETLCKIYLWFMRKVFLLNGNEWFKLIISFYFSRRDKIKNEIIKISNSKNLSIVSLIFHWSQLQ